MSKLFSAFYVFVKDVNEFFGTKEENMFDDDSTRSFYRAYTVELKKKHRTSSILASVLAIASIPLGAIISAPLGILGFLVCAIGAIYHTVRMKYFHNEYFRVRER